MSTESNTKRLVIHQYESTISSFYVEVPADWDEDKISETFFEYNFDSTRPFNQRYNVDLEIMPDEERLAEALEPIVMEDYEEEDGNG